MRLVLHSSGPERDPAKSRLQHRKAEIGIAIQETGAKERAHRPHRAPGVRRGAAKEWVVPEVAIARVPLREAMVDEAQPRLVHGLPDRVQVGVVQRVVNRQVDVHTNRPW